jgi:DNA-binding GntR family transcriptional regulator
LSPASSTVDSLAGSLRQRILDGALRPGTPLREEALSSEYEVARHSLRSALRTLQGEGIVEIEPNRGARVKSLSPEDVQGLSELRIALELEAARMVLARDGLLPPSVHEALGRLVRACRRSRPSWGSVAELHEELHHAIVAAADSPRLTEAHGRAGAELRLFVLQLPDTWTFERIARDHEQLVADLEARGAEALRPHIEESTAALLDSG